MRLLFVIPRVEDSKIKRGYPHIGIGYLSELLLSKNMDHEILDMTLGYNLEYLKKKVEQYNPDVVAVTTYSYRFNKTKNVIDFLINIKNKFRFKILLGGPHVSCLKTKSMFDGVDFGIKGEGEVTLREFSDVFDRKIGDYSGIPGLIWKKDELIIENQDRPWIDDLDQIPFPKYGQFEFDKYPSLKEKYMRINTSRGCPYQCIFCSVKFVGGNKFRSKSSKYLLEEIGYWHNRGYKIFEFVDDNFTFDKKRVLELCNLLINNKLNIKFDLFGGVRVDSVDKRILATMKKCGLGKIIYGVETTNEQVLKSMKKGITLKQIKEALKITKELGIPFGLFFSIGHPGQTYADVIHDLAFLKKEKAREVFFSNMIPYPGSELKKWVDENASYVISKSTYLDTASYHSDTPVYETNDFKREERSKALKKAHSFSRKKLMIIKFGDVLGNVLWLVTEIGFVNRFVYYLRQTQIGRNLFNSIKKE